MASFASAFRSARSSGKSTFRWNGKLYNTKLASDSAPKPKPRTAKPTAKPEKQGPSRPAAEAPAKTASGDTRARAQAKPSLTIPKPNPEAAQAAWRKKATAKRTGPSLAATTKPKYKTAGGF
jgi:hypothetical protein